MDYDNNLSLEEKKNLMEDLFPKTKEYIENVGNYLADNFKKIDGFDYRWSSLISSKPLLFEDVDYVRVRDFIINGCTKNEIEAYRTGKLRKLYSTFESMLIDNLERYDRIMQFCTMLFCKYVRISENTIVNDGLKNLPYYFEMTATQVWCCALSYIDSTEWELNYAWKFHRKPVVKKHEEGKSLLESNYKYIYANPLFARFIEYCSIRTEVPKFIYCYQNDKTSNYKLSQVCSKFTKTSTAIDESQLETLSEYIFNDDKVSSKLYEKLVDAMNLIYKDSDNYAIFVLQNAFYIYSKDCKLEVIKDEFRNVTKNYLSNTFKCLITEYQLKDTIQTQIEWVRSKIDDKYNFDKEILKTIFIRMLNENYRDIIAYRKQSDKTYSIVTFKKNWTHYKALEIFYHNGMIVNEMKPVNYGDKNMANYIINRGYFLFGTQNDIDIILVKGISKKTLINHYSNYCIPVMNHMKDIISLYERNTNEINEVLLTGNLATGKINNKNIKYTKVYGNHLTNQEIMKQIKLINNGIKESKGKRNIWQVYE